MLPPRNESKIDQARRNPPAFALRGSADALDRFREWAFPACAPAAVAMLAVALMHVIAASPADAAAGQARHAQPVEAKAPRPAAEPIMAIVSIKNQQVTFYDADGWILRAPVSTGTT